jgi:hypothetical protein
MSSLEMAIAWRYLRSRRGSKLLSFISVIAIVGVVVGVSALIVVMGVMNGLQRDLREKILIGSPDIRVLNFGADMRIDDWQNVLRKVKAEQGVVAAGPFVMTQCLVNAGHAYMEGGNVVGLPPQTRDVPEVTDIRKHATIGDFRFASSDGAGRGIVLGKLMAGRLNAFVGDTVTLVCLGKGEMNAVTGQPVPLTMRFEVTGVFDTGMYEYDNSYMYVSLPIAQELAGLGVGVTGIEVKTRNRWEAQEVGDRLEKMLDFPYRKVDWQEQKQVALPGAQAREARHGPHPVADRPRGRVQHREQPDDGSRRQDPRDRDSQGDGDDVRLRPQSIFRAGSRDRSGRNTARCPARYRGFARARQIPVHKTESRDLFHRSPAGRNRGRRHSGNHIGKRRHRGAGDALPFNAGRAVVSHRSDSPRVNTSQVAR